MSAIEQTVKDLLAAWEAHDLNKTVRLLANNFELTGIAPDPLYKETFIMFQRVHNEAFPDWRFNVLEIRSDNRQVYLTFQIMATHQGIYDLSKLGVIIPPIPATGKFCLWPEEHMICKVKNGKIIHIHLDTVSSGRLAGALEWLGVKLPILFP